MSDAATLMVLADAHSLASISLWPPAGALIEEAYSAARGGDALGIRDARRLSEWARRWHDVPGELAAFYAAHDDSPEVARCLWHLFGEKQQYQIRNPMVTVRLKEMYEEWSGKPVTFSLVWP